MPIDYSQYHPKWKLISWLIRVKRAKNKCEWCEAPNGQLIYRPNKGMPDWKLWPEGMESEALSIDGYKSTKIVLTVAHIDHDKKNNCFNNLVALCQRCHLKHDIHQHVANRKYGRNWKGDHQLKIDL
jgi:hypothetical protein